MSYKTSISTPPGNALAAHTLSHEVISCAEAAAAKMIPLAKELKTLILDTDKGIYALHLPGDKQASFRKVKKALSVQQAFLVSPEKLEGMGLMAGTVSPVINPVWSFPHLISEKLLTFDFVSTNNGTRSKYFTFDPRILLDARTVLLGDFEA